jgi:hypothetical protein
MVYSLDTWKTNQCVACGLGNGEVLVYEFQEKEMTLKSALALHSSMVVCVCCIERVERRYFVISGANDGKIAVSIMTDQGLTLLSEKQHPSKINWITVDVAGNIIVADQTPFVSIYGAHF